MALPMLFTEEQIRTNISKIQGWKAKFPLDTNAANSRVAFALFEILQTGIVAVVFLIIAIGLWIDPANSFRVILFVIVVRFIGKVNRSFERKESWHKNAMDLSWMASALILFLVFPVTARIYVSTICFGLALVMFATFFVNLTYHFLRAFGFYSESLLPRSVGLVGLFFLAVGFGLQFIASTNS